MKAPDFTVYHNTSIDGKLCGIIFYTPIDNIRVLFQFLVKDATQGLLFLKTLFCLSRMIHWKPSLQYEY